MLLRSLAPAARLMGRRLSSLAEAPKVFRLEPQLEKVISRFESSMKAGRGVQTVEKSQTLVEDFGALQRFHVQKVLLVCSDYDSYTFEEEGLLNELMHQRYNEHSLSRPPTIDRVSSPASAVEQFQRKGDYDMVIALSRIAAQSNLAADILRIQPSTPIALIALTPSELTSSVQLVDESMRLNVNKRLMWEKGHSSSGAAIGTAKPAAPFAPSGSVGADSWIWPFMWQGSPQLFTAIFKAVEDRINAANDIEYGVGVIMVIEDSVKFYSSYLPLLYSELWSQNQLIQGETMQPRERILRMLSRPKVIFCTNYEEASDVYDRYRDNMFGVITDMGFPKDGVHREHAGLQFVSYVKEQQPELPVLMQSASREDSPEANAAVALGAKFVCKSSTTLLQSLRDYMREDLMFGPLKFQDGISGKEIGSVSTVSELMTTWEGLPLSSVAFHARQSHLSRWFFARAEFALAKRFRASQYPQDFIDADGRERPDWLRNWILSEARAHRNKLASNIEDVSTADASTPIVRLGSGSLGGKGRGFRFLHQLSEKFNMATVIPELELVVPRCFILATSVFDDFMETNNLIAPALNAATDEEVHTLFEAASLPSEVTAELHKFLQMSSGPLAVRSSSLFEDAFMQPFAGIYSSEMLPNSSAIPLDERLEHLSWAVKRVYASTFSQEAQRYASSMSNRSEEEKMAVILQPLVGAPDESGNYFYPTLAGVANSVDFYPQPHTATSHGCAQLGLGLGVSVVDNTPAVHFSLSDPRALTGPPELPVTALDLAAMPGSGTMLATLPPAAASLALQTVPKASSATPAPNAATAVPLISDVHGERVVFKRGYGEVVAGALDAADEPPPLRTVPLPQILNGEVPLATALAFLLRLGRAGLGCPVEIEFALQARKAATDRHQLHVLQIRPQAHFREGHADRFAFLPSSDYAAIASTRALGHGRFNGISDVVYVSPDRFDASATAGIAAEIGAINAKLRAEGRKYLLMAPGRWGSNDTSRGIPVTWPDIDSAAVIVETVLDKHVPISQGSHFFQNIISFGLGYMTVDPESSSGKSAETADYSFWDSQADVGHGTQYVRHVQTESPLEIVVDGQSRHGVVMRPGRSFDVFVAQVDQFISLEREQYGSMS